MGIRIGSLTEKVSAFSHTWQSNTCTFPTFLIAFRIVVARLKPRRVKESTIGDFRAIMGRIHGMILIFSFSRQSQWRLFIASVHRIRIFPKDWNPPFYGPFCTVARVSSRASVNNSAEIPGRAMWNLSRCRCRWPRPSRLGNTRHNIAGDVLMYVLYGKLIVMGECDRAKIRLRTNHGSAFSISIMPKTRFRCSGTIWAWMIHKIWRTAQSWKWCWRGRLREAS